MTCEHDWREGFGLPLQRPLYFGLDAEPICSACWCAIRTDPEAIRVALTVLGSGVQVSTVWLGLDHGFMGEAPLILETMVFGGALDQQDTWRYSTREQALAGHQEVVELVRLELAATDPASTDPRTADHETG